MTVHTIRYPAPWGDAVLAITDVEAAGAAHSFKWPVGATNGVPVREFLNAGDDGRLLQSAVSFDGQGEAFNPTEGGSSYSAPFMTPSSSRLLCHSAQSNILKTATQMAFWKKVGTALRSNHLLQKQITLGYRGTWNLIEVRPTFILPDNETHWQAQFEILTGYMPPGFSVFETLDYQGNYAPLSDGPGEQALPVVLSTPDQLWAMGAWSPGGTPGGGYGRWRFAAERCVKWNVVSRVSNPAPGAYPFKVIVAYGSRADVRQSLLALFPLGAAA